MEPAFLQLSDFLSLQQTLILMGINLVGVCGIILIILLMRKPPPRSRERIILSLKLGAVALLLFAVILGDVAFSLWMKSPDSRPVVLVVLITIFCGVPFLFPMVVVSSLIQLLYWDMWKDYLDHKKRGIESHRTAMQKRPGSAGIPALAVSTKKASPASATPHA